MNFVFKGSNNSEVFYSVKAENLCMHTHTHMQMLTRTELRLVGSEGAPPDCFVRTSFHRLILTAS